MCQPNLELNGTTWDKMGQTCSIWVKIEKNVSKLVQLGPECKL